MLAIRPAWALAASSARTLPPPAAATSGIPAPTLETRTLAAVTMSAAWISAGAIAILVAAAISEAGIPAATSVKNPQKTLIKGQNKNLNLDRINGIIHYRTLFLSGQSLRMLNRTGIGNPSLRQCSIQSSPI